MVLLTYIYSQRLFRINYETFKIVALILLGIVTFFISLIFPDSDPIINIVQKVCLIVLFPFALYLLRFYETSEILTIKSLFKKVLKK